MRFECHITTEYVAPDDPSHDRLRDMTSALQFRLASLHMSKGGKNVLSDYDTFMTGHSDTKQDIMNRMKWLVRDLNGNGFKVTRYKIEEVLFDSRNGDK